MKSDSYENLEDAINSIIANDQDYILIKHELEKDESIGMHFHKKANEWVIANSGTFKVNIGGKESECRPDGRYAVIHFPKNIAHSFLALSDITYFVVRDRNDKTIYC